MKKMTKAEISAAVAKLPGWSVKDGKLHREYKFAGFSARRRIHDHRRARHRKDEPSSRNGRTSTIASRST